jgi:hypothetical protein
MVDNAVTVPAGVFAVADEEVMDCGNAVMLG